MRILCLLSTLRFTTIVSCIVLAWLCVSDRDTFLSLCFNKNLVSKVGLVNKVCNFQRQIVNLWNTMWLNIPTQRPENQRVVFLIRSDPCACCASQLSVVVQPPEFSSRIPAHSLATVCGHVKQCRQCSCPEHGASSCTSVW